jgi:hypothetical protein
MGNGERGTSSAVEATVEREDGEFGCAGGLEEQKRSADVFLVPAVSQEKRLLLTCGLDFPTALELWVAFLEFLYRSNSPG